MQIFINAPPNLEDVTPGTCKNKIKRNWQGEKPIGKNPIPYYCSGEQSFVLGMLYKSFKCNDQ